VELQRQQEGFRKRGLAVAALSYDSPELLKDFAARREITYPLLADRGSAAIRAFGLLNPEYPEGHVAHGVPYPGILIVDERGIVREKYFEEKYTNRRTAASILALLGGEEPSGRAATARHLALRTAPEMVEAFAGSRVTLVADLQIDKGLHAYAPGAGSYRPLRLRLEADPHFTAHEAVMPAPHPFEFKPLHETVPVFEGRVRVLQDLTLAGEKELADVLATTERTLSVRGTLEYQVCSDKTCFPPASLPVSWTLRLHPLDRERAPAALRR
jgi:hypothetical protein